MNLHTLPKTTQKKKKRLGAGLGSGRGKTAGRGTKGQKARGKIPLYFEGGALPLIKRLPFRRGKGKNKVFKKKQICINVKNLSQFPKGSKIDLKFLIEKKLVTDEDARMYGVKILGDGELLIPLTVVLPVSKGARKKIEKAGGKIEITLP
ncbi:MAG: 50S ribosomal protein L15 [Candidatus Levybacteria bacterium RIFCSPHIGHO2_12_FULL_38_12]|nr:MAG: 50S ribosomal protein L15 [Candidatus Levybacteria bacterium RIFCSPHIGHO2_01_FULL_38_12]OGH21956.1 MAG: 50S ribosomal protein L15 [Candidatus Levybacteria bacterium RIFCSPHIGHO2_02_FULL_37_18]OGH23028.1 MAG: 50S ribosomal protein L15 [Candidatus Levybacteria bacterium RIFCSPHIGHO2_12_FULL_38_12]OGH33650.1 MAG: 50S ribosomal protein L15 [Candidatus Levybacteria bacterium RIFCSPLOWO2_01_FULL_37_20]OGH44555.1 MAG: 50S ribosomal protein L15 [Candidatus Levybacteria bacterium RIFCSPLOWO2_02_